MGFRVEIFKSSAWRDVSDYVIDISEIPFLKRNRDYSINTEGFNFSISQKYTSFTFAADDPVMVYHNNTAVFRGLIFSVQPDLENHLCQIDVIDAIVQLKDYMFDYATCGTLINTYDTTLFINDLDRSLIRLENFIKALFESCGFTVDWTYWTDQSMGTKWAYNMRNSTGTPDIVSYANLLLSEVWFIPNMMYCINQTWAAPYSTIDDGDVREANKITCYDLLSFLASIFRLVYVPASATSYYIVTDDFVPIADSNTYGLKIKPVEAQYEVLQLETDFILLRDFNYFPDGAAMQYYVDGGAFEQETLSVDAYSSSPVKTTDETRSVGTILWYKQFLPLIIRNNFPTPIDPGTPDEYYFVAFLVPYLVSLNDIAFNYVYNTMYGYDIIKYETDVYLQPADLYSISVDVAGAKSIIEKVE